MKHSQLVILTLPVFLQLYAFCHKTDTQPRRRGPNVCRGLSRGVEGADCCPGWKPRGVAGLCVTAVCKNGCEAGICVAPNVCRCPNGILQNRCQSRSRSQPDVYDRRMTPIQNDQPPPFEGCERMKCHQTCQVIHGYPQCTCMIGFLLREDGLTCQDVDECQNFDRPCQHDCRNTIGSFVCVCRHGYSLMDNGQTCRPVSDYSTSACGPGNKGESPCQTNFEIFDQSENVLPKPMGVGWSPCLSSDCLNPKEQLPSLVDPMGAGWSPCLSNGCLDPEEQQDLEFPEGFLEWLRTNQDIDKLSELPGGFSEWLGADSIDIPNFQDGGPEELQPCIGPGPNCSPQFPPDYLPCQLSPCSESELPELGDVVSGTKPFPMTNECGTGDTNCLQAPVECHGSSCHGYDLECHNGGCSEKPSPSVHSSVFWQKLKSQEENCNSKLSPASKFSSTISQSGKTDDIVAGLFDMTNSGGGQVSKEATRSFDSKHRNDPDVPYSYSQAKALLMSDTRADQDNDEGNHGNIRETSHVDSNKRRHHKTYPEEKVNPPTKQDGGLEMKIKIKNFKDGKKDFTETRTKSVAGRSDIFPERESMLADTVACRDDLCIESLISKSLLDLEDKDDIICPPGYHKTLNDGVTFCQPMGNDIAGHSDTNPCPEGQRLVETTTGNVCEDLDQHETCPDGYSSTEVNGEIKCIKKDLSLSKDRVRCPDGQILYHTLGESVCRLPKDIPVFCNLDEQAVDTMLGFVCVDVAVHIPTCVDSARLNRTTTGFECVLVGNEVSHVETKDQPCPVGSLRMQNEDSFICVPMTTEGVRCPEGHIAVESADGLVCQPSATPMPTCPAGLVQVETPVGILCRYKAPAHSEELLCQNGERLTITAGGFKCERETTAPPPRSLTKVACLSGQVLINTPQGATCGFTTDSEDTQETSPCPPGLVVIETEKGVMCQYRSVEKRIDQNPCPKLKILTQTRTGFVCHFIREDLGEKADDHVCSESQRLVQTKAALECVDAFESLLVCSQGMELMRENGRFLCRETSSPMRCAQGEILVVNEAGMRCLKAEGVGVDLCGEGYRMVSTSEGAVCRALKMKLDCPEGFVLVKTMGRMQCVSKKDSLQTAKTCADGYVPEADGEGYSCTLGKTDLLPCERDGGLCGELSDLYPEGSCIPDCSNDGVCLNGTCICPPGITGKACQDDVDECEGLPDRFCQNHCENSFGSYQCVCPDGHTLNADGRTCKEIECMRQCLNGGRCVRGECQCPQGFMGTLCQEDIDECARSPFLCEHVCRNTFGGYACICPPGSRLQPDRRTCRNTTCIPECKNGGQCVDHRCLCRRGYRGVVCQLDINECMEDQPCSHQCQNLPGSYRCQCPSGLVMEADQHTCHNATLATPSGGLRGTN
ncbi:hypothetical protein ScPMuIL_002642 [Solemya velum]